MNKNILINIAVFITAILGIVLCFVAVFTIVVWLSWLFKPTHTGERVGQIIKLSKGGLFYKTWEAEILKGGMANGSGGFAKPLNFTIPNKDKTLLSQVQYAMDSGKQVVLYYHTEKHCVTTSDTHSCTFGDRIQFTVN